MLWWVPVPFPVLHHIVQQEHDRQHDRNRVHGNDGDLRGHIFRRVFVAEGEWTEDVAEAEAHEQNRIVGDLFGVALKITCL